MARADAPAPANVLGLVMGGPVIMAHGTDEQKERWLEPILSGEEIWCQGFSEPESGSDLASLKTKATKVDGGWSVTGQKVWTTFAHESKWCMLVARTDPEVPKHKGLTYFICDMEQDGVEIRPLVQITGEAEFNEVFFQEAFVPDENLVGGEGNGWMVAITTLMNERAGLGGGAAVAVSRDLAQLIALINERGMQDDPQIRRTGRRPADRLRGPAARGHAGDDRADEDRDSRSRGLDRKVAVGEPQPVADRARLRHPRDRGVGSRHRRGPTGCCAAAPTRSRAAPPR